MALASLDAGQSPATRNRNLTIPGNARFRYIVALSITVLAIITATLINDARIGDFKEAILAELDACFTKLDVTLRLVEERTN